VPKKPVIKHMPSSDTSEEDELSFDLMSKDDYKHKFDIKMGESRGSELSFAKSTARTNIFDAIEDRIHKSDFAIECEIVKTIWNEGQLFKLSIINKLVSSDKLILNLYKDDKLIKAKTINCEGLKYLFKKVNYLNYIPFYYKANDSNKVNEIISTVLFQLINIKTIQENFPYHGIESINSQQEFNFMHRKAMTRHKFKPKKSRLGTFLNIDSGHKNLTEVSANPDRPVKLTYSIDLNPIPVSLLPDTEIDLLGCKYLFSFVHLKGLLFRIYLHSLKNNKSIDECKSIDVSFQNHDFITYFEINNDKVNTSINLIKVNNTKSVHIIDGAKDEFSKRILNILRAVYKKFDKNVSYKQLYDYLRIEHLGKSRYMFHRIHLKTIEQKFVTICATHEAEDGKLISHYKRDIL